MIAPEILKTIRPVVEIFEKLNIPYYVGGSLASSAFGVPRSTLDVDLVADLKKKHVDPIVNHLMPDYYTDKDTILDAIGRRSSFNIIDLKTMFKIDVFVLKYRAYDKEAFQRKRKKRIDKKNLSSEFYIASLEDIVLNKLEWFRLGNETSERQWNDVLGVLKVQRGRIDLNYLQHWAHELNISDLLDRALKDAGC